MTSSTTTRRRTRAAVAVLCGALAGAVALAPACAAPAATAATGTTSKTAAPKIPTNTHWLSGAWPSDTGDVAAVQTFAAFRHRKLDIVSAIVPRTTWADLASASWVAGDYQGFAGRLSIGLPLNVDDGTTLSDVAAGLHDDSYRQLATSLVQLGRGNAFLRLGWEFNGDWYPWAAEDPTAYKAAFVHISTLLKSISPAFRIEWDGNFGHSQVNHNPFTTLYPGDQYVDVIGVDAYDRKWFRVTNASSWKTYQTMSGGLNQWYGFAVKHHKKLAVPEWAVYSDGGYDNAYYVARMHDFFASHAKNLAYESYFNASGPEQVSSLVAPVQNPRAGAAYAKLWKKQG